MRRLAFAILFSVEAWAASYTATATGDWSLPATWGGAGVPGNGDTVSIHDGVTVNITDTRIAGTSGPHGTIAINCNNSGTLVIAAGGTLVLRGDIEYTTGSGTNSSPYLAVQAGGVLKFDASQAASPSATNYAAHQNGNYGFRPFYALGIPGLYATITSNPSGGSGAFTLGGWMVGGAYNITYTNISNLGGSTLAAFAQWDTSGQTPWVATHNTFTNCGLAPQVIGSMGSSDIFQHDYNVHSASLGATVMNRPGDATGMQPICNPVGTPSGCTSIGVRELIANVFDIAADSSFDARDFTIHSNYFGNKIGFVNYETHAWWYFQNNFYRQAPATSPGELLLGGGDVRDDYFLLDDPYILNPHGVDVTAVYPASFSGLVEDHSGAINTQISSFLITNVYAYPNATYSLSNSILLPNAAGNSSFWLSAVVNMNSQTSFSINHNTAIVNSPNNGLGVMTAHPTTPANFAGQLTSYQNNILWNPVAANQAYKLQAAQNINLNVCQPQGCNYNDGWNMLTDGGGFSGGANGYADNFSGGTPGANDLAVNPLFVDSSRNLATFDSAYLGYSYPGWSSDNTYTTGSLVSYADPNLYGNTAIGFPQTGALINYRYWNGKANGVSCDGQNPQPSLYTDLARACWEWASLYHMRQAVAAQTLYDDQDIGVHGADIITVLMQWVRAGFSPTNQALALAGSDGADIGAVAVTVNPPLLLHRPPGSTLRGLVMRGGVAR